MPQPQPIRPNQQPASHASADGHKLLSKAALAFTATPAVVSCGMRLVEKVQAIRANGLSSELDKNFSRWKKLLAQALRKVEILTIKWDKERDPIVRNRTLDSREWYFWVWRFYIWQWRVKVRGVPSTGAGVQLWRGS